MTSPPRTRRGTPTPGRRSSAGCATGQMPPAGQAAGRGRTYASVLAELEAALDRAAADTPEPGPDRHPPAADPDRVPERRPRPAGARHRRRRPCCRPTRPATGSTTSRCGDLSPTLLDRYITAAQKISRLAVGRRRRSPGGDTIRVRPDITQEDHVDGLPARHARRHADPLHLPAGRRVRGPGPPARATATSTSRGCTSRTSWRCCSTGERVQSFTVKPPPAGKGSPEVDAHLKARLSVTAGPHDLGVTFLKKPAVALETQRQPYQAHFNMHRHPRLQPGGLPGVDHRPVRRDKGPGDTPSRRRIFVAGPTVPDEEEACAKKILATLMRRAYRRPVADADVERVAAVLPRGRGRRRTSTRASRWP